MRLSPPPTPTTWMTRAEAAAHLRCHQRTVDRAIRAGELPAFRWRGKVLLDYVAVDRMVRKERVG